MTRMGQDGKCIIGGADRLSPSERSRVMRSVRGKDTVPELTVRSALHRAGFRFRIHRKDLPGKPDIVLPMYRSVIFVNGCFWHQHNGCSRSTIPISNRRFWKKKLARTVVRDRENAEALRKQGWCVITIWECELKNRPGPKMERVFEELRKAKP